VRLEPARTALLVIDLQNDTVGADALVRGIWGAEPVVAPTPGDLVVEKQRYEVVVVTDATATISEEFQRAALDYALTRVATRATADEVVAALQA
jgi:nicotinamidase-related amidase